MPEPRLSYQQLDPVGSFGSRPITLVFSAVIVAVGAGGLLLTWSDVTDPIAGFLAILACALSVLAIVYWSSPLRAPFSRAGFVVVVTLAGLSLVLGPLATWGQLPTLVNQWASVTVGLTLVQLSSYRATRELGIATILHVILIGFVTILQPGIDRHALPVLVIVLDAALPVAGLGMGAAGYSAAMTRWLGRWYSRGAADEAASPAMKATVARSVHDGRVSILNHTVVPFLTEILAKDAISADDRDRARIIAAAIRSAMVADVDRNWLDAIMDQLAREKGDPASLGSEAIEDPDRLSNRMSTEQRIVMRAFIVALFAHRGFDPDGFGITISRGSSVAAVALTAKLDGEETPTRTSLAAYFAVLRIAFGGLHVSFQAPTLTLKFDYDHK